MHICAIWALKTRVFVENLGFDDLMCKMSSIVNIKKYISSVHTGYGEIGYSVGETGYSTLFRPRCTLIQPYTVSALMNFFLMLTTFKSSWVQKNILGPVSTSKIVVFTLNFRKSVRKSGRNRVQQCTLFCPGEIGYS